MHLSFELPADDSEAEVRMAESAAFSTGIIVSDDSNCVNLRHKNFRIKYIRNERKGFVQGSLHTFALEDNTGCFTASLVKSACVALAEELGVPADLLLVTRLEIGVNIKTPTSPQPFLHSFLTHKKKPFHKLEPPAKSNKVYQLFAPYVDYKIKCYDKGGYNSQQGKLTKGYEHLLRYEVVIYRKRQWLPLVNQMELTLENLARPEVLLAFAGHLEKHWKLVKRRIEMPFEGMKFKDALLLNAYNSPHLWKCMKATTPPSTLSYHRRMCNQMWDEAQYRKGPHPYEALFLQHLKMLLPDEAEITTKC